MEIYDLRFCLNKEYVWLEQYVLYVPRYESSRVTERKEERLT